MYVRVKNWAMRLSELFTNIGIAPQLYTVFCGKGPSSGDQPGITVNVIGIPAILLWKYLFFFMDGRKPILPVSQPMRSFL